MTDTPNDLDTIRAHMPPGYKITDSGTIQLHRHTPPTPEECAWMWTTSLALHRTPPPHIYPPPDN